MTPIRIDIVSDIACPWCAIGYARLEQAMRALEDEFRFEIEWHAFELNPDPTAPSQPIVDVLVEKYGRSREEIDRIQAEMVGIATGLGLDFSGMETRHTHNTFDAHRLVKWAKVHGRQTAMKQALFTAYFGRAADIASHDKLLDCAQAAGLDRDAARQVLESGDCADSVRDDEARYQRAGVSAVPAFIINEKYLISGAQDCDTLVDAVRRIAAEANERSGEAASTDTH